MAENNAGTNSSQSKNASAPQAPPAPAQMTQIQASEVKKGNIVILKGHPVRVIDVVQSKEGKH